MKSPLRGADLLARSLAAAGAKHLFALSGNHVMPVFDGALDAGLQIIHVRHEAAAVHMADAWGRLTGEPGVALVTGGPGHANAVGALYTALESESPLVLISGHAPLAELGKGAFQEMNQAALAAPVTKASWVAQSADNLAADIVKAWCEAKSGTPGPVHLSIPNDVLDAVVDSRLPTAAQFATSGEGADEAYSVGTAQRPLIVAGPAAMRKGTRELEEATGIPVIGMESPRGVNDPSLGRLAEVLARADLVLLLGKQVDFTLKFGKAFAPGARVVQAQSVRGIQFENREWLEEVRAALRYRPQQWSSIRSGARGPVHPVELCREVQKLI